MRVKGAGTFVDGDVMAWNATNKYLEPRTSGSVLAERTVYAVLANDVSTTNASVGSGPSVFGLTVAASTTYLVEYFLICTTAATTTGYRLYLNGPASPTSLVYSFQGQASTNTNSTGHYYANDYLVGYSGDFTGANTNKNPAYGWVLLVNGANAGTLTLGLDSEVAGSSVSVIAGSIMRSRAIP